MNVFKEKIKAMKCMQDPLLLYRMHKDTNLKLWYEDYYNCHTMFKFHELGNLNRDKLIYIIKILFPGWGFFASWKRVCMGLLVAERYGFIPVVDWSLSKYREDYVINGSDNPFEYYFEPVSDISLEDALKSHNVTYYSNNSNGFEDTTYDLQGGKIDDFAGVNGKYIHIKPVLLVDMLNQIRSMNIFNKKTIGVHIRQMGHGDILAHPVPVTTETYLKEVDKALDEHGFEQIFLAADSEDATSEFRKRYGEKLVCFEDIARKATGSTVEITDDSRAFHDGSRYRLGYEVLRDMLTLSYCQGFVPSVSNVSLAAEVFKKSRGEEYSFKSEIKQELCEHGISAEKAGKLMKTGKYDKKKVLH